jgi:hypothetical protein
MGFKELGKVRNSEKRKPRALAGEVYWLLAAAPTEEDPDKENEVQASCPSEEAREVRHRNTPP